MPITTFSRYMTLVHLIKQSAKSALKTQPLTGPQLRALLRTLVDVASKLEEVASDPQAVYVQDDLLCRRTLDT